MRAAHKNELEAIFVDHYKEWCLIAISYLENRDEAEDVVQDVIVKLLQRGNADDVLNLKSYISMAVRNASLTRIRSLKKLRKVQIPPPTVPSHEIDWIRAETTADMHRSIEALPDQSKKAFKLCVMDGLNYEKAADTMGISVNTVKYHLKKSFKILRFTLRNSYYFITTLMQLVIF
jgi:RNA polymerase sigma-70 factor (ECF subfamily)